MFKEYFVYILQCSDSSYYVGLTNNVERRVHQHNLGMNSDAYTYKRRPVYLVYSSCFTDVWEAISCEKRIKRWSRKKKEALIDGDYEQIKALSQNSYARRIYSLIASNRKMYVMVSPSNHDMRHPSTGSG